MPPSRSGGPRRGATLDGPHPEFAVPCRTVYLNDFDIVMGIEMLLNHLEPTDLDDSERESGMPNLGLLIDAAMARRIDLGDNLLSRRRRAPRRMPAATPCLP